MNRLQTWQWLRRLPPPSGIKPVRADLVLIGELGLSGELRMVGQINARLREAASLGFKTAIVPQRLHNKERWPEGIEVKEARSLKEALKLALVE